LNGDDGTDPTADGFQIYFWDVDWQDFRDHAELYKDFLICHLADKGNEQAFRWLKENFSLLDVGQIVLRSRQISPKTRRFWENYVAYLRASRQT